MLFYFVLDLNCNAFHSDVSITPILNYSSQRLLGRKVKNRRHGFTAALKITILDNLFDTTDITTRIFHRFNKI